MVVMYRQPLSTAVQSEAARMAEELASCTRGAEENFDVGDERHTSR